MNKYNTKMFYDNDADIEIIRKKRVLIIGYGNQGRAQAKNLIDSGVKVWVGLRYGSKSLKKTNLDQVKVKQISDGVEEADIISFLIPDQNVYDLYEKIKKKIRPGQTLLFSHGYNIFYNKIRPPEFVNIIMVAPSGAGIVVREAFKKNSGVPNLIAIQQDYTKDALRIALSYSKAIGGTRAGAFLSTFKEETESDLFGEQAVLCGGIPELIKAAFNVLVDKGFQPIVAWYVCFYEVKLIVDVFHKKGFEHMYKSISETAEYGGLKNGTKIINRSVKRSLEKILEDIQSKKFFNEFENDAKNQFKELKGLRKRDSGSRFEETTKFLNNI
mgnify:CR=1 FL=1